MTGDAFRAGYDARAKGGPHNPRNSADWKRGYAWAAQMIADDREDRDGDDWMIDREMEAKG